MFDLSLDAIPVIPRVFLLPLLTEVHGHLRRDPEITPIVVAHAVEVCEVSAAEPNLRPEPVLTVAQALDYQAYLVEQPAVARRPDHRFLMILQLTPHMTPEMVREAYANDIRIIKYYPAGVTTNSDNGIKDWKQCYAAIAAMAELCRENPGLPMVLQTHGEDPNQENHHQREADFLVYLEEIATTFPDLIISFAHASTAAVVELAKRLPNVGLEITVHHMVLTWGDVVHDHESHGNDPATPGVVNGDCFCAPVVKTEDDRDALLKAARGEIPELVGRTYVGLDYAPHKMTTKVDKHGRQFPWPPPTKDKVPAMGVYSLDVAVQLLLSIFLKREGDISDSIRRLENFMCYNGAKWFGIKVSGRKVLKLTRQPYVVPESYGGVLRSFMAGQTLDWTLERIDI